MTGIFHSFLEILTFLYFYHKKDQLFNYENLSSNDVKRILTKNLDKCFCDKLFEVNFHSL